MVSSPQQCTENKMDVSYLILTKSRIAISKTYSVCSHCIVAVV